MSGESCAPARLRSPAQGTRGRWRRVDEPGGEGIELHLRAGRPAGSDDERRGRAAAISRRHFCSCARLSRAAASTCCPNTPSRIRAFATAMKPTAWCCTRWFTSSVRTGTRPSVKCRRSSTRSTSSAAFACCSRATRASTCAASLPRLRHQLRPRAGKTVAQVRQARLFRAARPGRHRNAGRRFAPIAGDRKFSIWRWCPARDRALHTDCTASVVLSLEPATGVGTVLYSTPLLWEFAYARENNGYKGDRLFKMLHARK